MTTQITYRVTTPTTRRTDLQYPGPYDRNVHLVQSYVDDARAITTVCATAGTLRALLTGLSIRYLMLTKRGGGKITEAPDDRMTPVQLRAAANDMIRAGTGRRPAPYGPTARYPR